MITLCNTNLLAANLFNEGGTINMSLILITMIIAIVFLIIGFINLKKDTNKVTKMLKLANDATLLSLALGFLFSVVGLIGAFDSIEAISDYFDDPRISRLTDISGRLEWRQLNQAAKVIRSDSQ